jgi:hypothetical protein
MGRFFKRLACCLDNDPRIHYFKMAEAANLSAKGQFARRLGWTEAKRDAKVELLISVIVRHVDLKVNCSVDKAAFVKYARSLAVPQRTSVIDKPYAMAFHHVLIATASVFRCYRVPASCDFIFDEHGKIGQDAVAMWDEVVNVVNADLAPYLGKRPGFANDKLCFPLQAADLYAWHIRRALSGDRLGSTQHNMRDLEKIPRTITRHIDEARLKSFRERMDIGAAVFTALCPNIELAGYKGTRSQQRSARAAARSVKPRRIC